MKNFKLDQNTNTSVDEPQVRLAWFFKKYKIEKNIRLAAQQLYKSVEKSHDILEKCRIQLITSDRKIDYYFSEIKALSYYNTVNGPHNSIANSQRLSIKSDNNISITEKSDTLPYSLSSSKSLAHQTYTKSNHSEFIVDFSPLNNGAFRFECLLNTTPLTINKLLFKINSISKRIQEQSKLLAHSGSFCHNIDKDAKERVENELHIFNSELSILKTSEKEYINIASGAPGQNKLIKQCELLFQSISPKRVSGFITFWLFKYVDAIPPRIPENKGTLQYSVRIDGIVKYNSSLCNSDNVSWNEPFKIKLYKARVLEISLVFKTDESIDVIGIFWFYIGDLLDYIESVSNSKTSLHSYRTDVLWLEMEPRRWALVAVEYNRNSENTNNTTISTSSDNYSVLINGDKSMKSQCDNKSIKSNHNNSINFDKFRTLSQLSLSSIDTHSLSAINPAKCNHNVSKKSSNSGTKNCASAFSSTNSSSDLKRSNVIRPHFHILSHLYASKLFYTVMLCSVCNRRIRRNVYICVHCKNAVHPKCHKNVMWVCIGFACNHSDTTYNYGAISNYCIPHMISSTITLTPSFCSHCGFIISPGRRIVFCKECKKRYHTSCIDMAPKFCGLTKEAALILAEALRKQEYDHQLELIEKLKNNQDVEFLTHLTDDNNIPTLDSISKNENVLFSGPKSTEKIPKKLSSPNSSKQKPSSLPPITVQSSSPINSGIDHSQSPHEQYTSTSPITTTVNVVSPPLSTTDNTPSIKHSECAVTSTTPSSKSNAAGQQSIPFMLMKFFNSKSPTPKHSDDSQPAEPLSVDTTNISPQADIPSPNFSPQQMHKSRYSLSSKSIINRKNPPKKQQDLTKSISSFTLIAVLGRGAFGTVFLAKEKRTKKLLALKALKKRSILQNGDIKSFLVEKSIFMDVHSSKFPYLVNLDSIFQSDTHVFFVMEYINGGDLMTLIMRKKRFPLEWVKFYSCEILLVLEYFHSRNIVYRDLKLDNILLCADGHIKVTDYGICKRNIPYGAKTSTFCGTPDYMAPEVLLNRDYDRTVDWWSFGILIYVMIAGKYPFRGEGSRGILKAILANSIRYTNLFSPESISLIKSLLNTNPKLRLGSGIDGSNNVKSHAFFKDVNWDTYYKRAASTPCKPVITNPYDVNNFDSEFTSEDPILAANASALTPREQKEFMSLSFVTTT